MYLVETCVMLFTLLILQYVFSKLSSENKLVHVLYLLVKTLVGFIFTIYCIIVGVPLAIFFWLSSTAIKTIIKNQNNKRIDEATGLDVIWGTNDDNTKPFITVFTRLRGKPNVGKARKLWSKEVMNVVDETGQYQFRKFRQLFVKKWDYYMWEDAEDYRIENHVKIVKLEEGDMKSTLIKRKDMGVDRKDEDGEKRFCKFLSSPKFPSVTTKCPQWQAVLVDDGDSESYILVMQIHHAIADGISMVRILLEKLVDTPMDMGEYRRNVPLYKRVLTYLWAIPMFPFSLRLILFYHPSNSLHGPQLTGKKIYASAPPIPLSELRELRTKAGVGVTDVLFSCLSSSIHKHFEKKNCKVPEIVVFYPVGYQDPTGPLKLNNIYGIGLTPIPITVENSVNQHKKSVGQGTYRLKHIKKCLDGVKSDPSYLGLYHVGLLMCSIIPHTILQFFFKARGITMGVSNMPGPKEKLKLMGDTMESIRFWVPDRAPTAAGFTMLSYNGSVRVSFNADNAVIKDWDEANSIMTGFMDELEKLKTELLPSGQ